MYKTPLPLGGLGWAYILPFGKAWLGFFRYENTGKCIRYSLYRDNERAHEPVLDKLKLNIRSLLDSVGTSDKALLDLCFDVIYHKDMKALGLHNLILLYAETTFETPAVEG